MAASLCWALGLASVLSFNVWADWYPLARLPGLATLTVFDSLDHVASNVLLPLGGFGLAIFGGWIIEAGALGDELGLGPGALRGITFVLRYVAPISIVAASIAPLVLR